MNPEAVAKTNEAVVKKLKHIWVGRLKYFKCDQFLKAAQELQSLEKEQTIECLSQLSPNMEELCTNLILCKMLFEPRGTLVENEKDLFIPTLERFTIAVRTSSDCETSRGYQSA